MTKSLPILFLALGAAAAVAQQPVPVLLIEFQGNRSADAALLKAQMRIVREGGWYTQQSLQTELRNVEAALQDLGYLRAQVGEPSVEQRTVAGKGTAAVIRIPIVEGPRYVLGDIEIRNAQAIKAATLMQMLPVRTGQPYSRRKLAQWQEKIEEAYRAMGYLRAGLTLREDVREARGIVHGVLECNEGNVYRIAKITVLGDESIDRSAFKRQILVGEGGVYNPENLSLSIQFLNTLRLYRPLSDTDVEVKIDDATSTVEIVFKLAPLRKSTSS